MDIAVYRSSGDAPWQVICGSESQVLQHLRNIDIRYGSRCEPVTAEAVYRPDGAIIIARNVTAYRHIPAQVDATKTS